MGRDRCWGWAIGVTGLSALATVGCTTATRPTPVEIAGSEAIGAPVAAPAAPLPVAPAPDVSSPVPVRGALSEYLGSLRRASCPNGPGDATGEALDIAATPITLGRLGFRRETVGLLRYAGGFHVESSDARFGGLSGLEVLDDTNLMAVSDQGDLVWIGLGEDGLTPVSARLASLRDEAGAVLRGKTDGDAEGLAWLDGVALVSFERNHRILAYDVGECGAEARGAAIVRDGFGGPLNEAFLRAGLDVRPNAGPEPLAVTPDWYVFVGTETMSGARGPLSARPVEAAASYDLTVEDGAPAFVGMDVLVDGDQARAFTLHRGFDSLTGNAIVISETVFERYLDQGGLPARMVSEIDERSHYRYRVVSSRRLAELGAAINNVDNFEGIAAEQRADGSVRIRIISDDNFSDRQRTLLMTFDLTE